MSARKSEGPSIGLASLEASSLRISLLVVTLALVAPVSLASDVFSARYDATAPGSVSADPSCDHPSVICISVPPGSTSVRLTFTDDNLPGWVPVPGRINTTRDGAVLERGSMCGTGVVPLAVGTTLVTVHFFPLPQNCDFPCEVSCDLAGVPTRGTLTADFRP